MSGFLPPRSRSVTAAAVLALLTGCLWLVGTVAMLSVWQILSKRVSVSNPQEIYVFVFVSVVGCLSLATVIGGFGILVRLNWARILLIIVSGPWLLFGWFCLRMLLPLPFFRSAHIATYAFAPAAAIVWVALLVGKKARAEFLSGASIGLGKTLPLFAVRR